MNEPTLTELLRLRLKVMREQAVEDLCPSFEAVALVVAGSAHPDTIRLASDHLKCCTACAEAAEILHDMDRTTPLLETASKGVTPSRTWAFAALGACALVLVAVLFVWPEHKGDEQAFTIKGKLDRIDVAVERQGRQFRLRAADQLQSGDRLGFFYTASRPGHLALFDVSGSGSVSVLFPHGATHSAAINSGFEVALPDGGVFTAPGGCEWLVAIFSDDSLPFESTIEIVRAAARAASTDCALEIDIPEARSIWVFPEVGR
jgi:hypothetical protein